MILFGVPAFLLGLNALTDEVAGDGIEGNS